MRKQARTVTVALLLVLGLVAAACTPEEIEASFNRITVSFEDGGAEAGLAEAVAIVQFAIPVIEMRLGSMMNSG